MNKKGFTVVEVVISFSILAVVLVSLFGFVVTYRDNIRNEEIRTELIDFKNTITKTIYDEIIRGNYVKIDYCIGKENCVIFTDISNRSHVLEMYEVETTNNELKRGLYIKYDGMNYFLPDSDLKDKNGYMCSFDSFLVESSNNIYSLRIPFKHVGLDEKYEISVVIN